MDKSIKKNGAYIYFENIKENGLGLIILETDDDEIRGIRLTLGNNENFSMKDSVFLAQLDQSKLAFTEILPKFVIKELKKTYKNNLKTP